MAIYHEVVLKYDKVQENGAMRRVKEKFIVDAQSLTEAETLVTKRMQPYISGEFIATLAKTTHIAEVCGADSEKYYMAKVAFITIDERTAAEKRTISQILVGASDFKQAYINIEVVMNGTMADWELVSLAETPYMDVIKAE